jgi:hypothetical protein
VAISACNSADNPSGNTNRAETEHAPVPPPTSSIPAHMETAPAKGSLPATLDPDMFDHFEARSAYTVARQAPELLAQLPCYCYCDRGMGHKSLHSCFEDRHASVCKICMDEAQLAVKLQKQGLSTADIRKQITNDFGRTK